jgi:hypothetical protein
MPDAFVSGGFEAHLPYWEGYFYEPWAEGLVGHGRSGRKMLAPFLFGNKILNLAIEWSGLQVLARVLYQL